MKTSSLLLLYFFLATISPLAAQYSTKSDKAIKCYERGNDLMKNRKYDEAFEQYTEALKKDTQFAEAHYKLAMLYQWYNQTEKMLYHFEQSISLQPNNTEFIGAYFHLCEKYLKEGNYEKSKNLGQKFLSLKPKQANKIAQVQLWIQSCDYAPKAMQNAQHITLKPLSKPLNNLYLQYFPVLTADQEMIFFTGAKKPASEQADYQEDIYFSQRKDTSWTSPKSISNKVNTPKHNEGTCTLTADGKTLIFTLCQEDKRTQKTNCDLYSSTWNGSEWSEPQSLGDNINTPAWESQPSLSADGKTLYFASNREGGIGGRDIWFAQKDESGKWAMPQNMGKNINTIFDESAPLLHANGKTLYFASNGRVGFGGYDLFQTNYLNNAWSEPQNLGFPINDSQDQIGFFVTTDAQKAYFSKATSLKDQVISSLLYEIILPTTAQPIVKSSLVKGIVYDSLTKKPLETTISLVNVNNNQTQAEASTDKTGAYKIVLNAGDSYSLQVKKEGYAFKNLRFDYTETKEPQNIEINIALLPIAKGQTFRLDNIYFEYAQFTLQEKSKTELDQLVVFMQQNPTIKGEISGHTDNVGNKQNNEKLSLNRAKAVFDYLVKAGVAPNRISYKGYGDSKPSASNDTEEGRAKNRRIEFEIK